MDTKRIHAFAGYRRDSDYKQAHTKCGKMTLTPRTSVNPDLVTCPDCRAAANAR